MTDIQDLYQEMILDHNRSPRNRRKIEAADRSANGHNPLCGDKLTVYLTLDGDRIVDAAFEGSGCAISTASASLMTETVKGKTFKEAEAVFEAFHRMLTGSSDVDVANMGKLSVFSGVCAYPARVKCATLAWHTVMQAVHDSGEVVSTES